MRADAPLPADDQDHAPGTPSSGTFPARGAQRDRPARLTSAEAYRESACLLDDSARCGERVDARLSNAAIGDACHVDEKRVREWRDPHAPRHMPAAALLTMPRELFTAFIERVKARRAELFGSSGAAPATAEAQAHVTTASLASAILEIATALASDGIDAGEAERIKSRLAAVVRDVERLFAKLEPSSVRAGSR